MDSADSTDEQVPTQVGTLSWEIVDWSADAPFAGQLVFSDDTGPLVWCALEPVLVRQMAEALHAVHEAQRAALLGPVQPDAPLNVAAPDVVPRRHARLDGTVQDEPAVSDAGNTDEGDTDKVPAPVARKRKKPRPAATEQEQEEQVARKIKNQRIGRYVVGGTIAFAVIDTLAKTVFP